MPKAPEPQSFETQGQRYSQAEDRNALLGQIASDFERERPSVGVRVTFQSDEMIVKYHCFEQWLDDRRRVESLTEEADKYLREFIKHLKSEFRKRGGGKLSMSEDKDRRGYDIQKVSLNGRFYFTYQQVYSF